METHDQIVTWLRDAHAMELSIESTLQRHIEDAKDLPDVRLRLEQHLAETRSHARRVAECLTSLGAGVSATKDVAGGVLGVVQGMSTALFTDELVKNALAEYAMEHLEIAAYSSLIAAAEDAGLVDISHTCSDILREEAAMANWLEDEIPKITRSYLERGESKPALAPGAS
jgi:ferritin-like metal-binding protein YciE